MAYLALYRRYRPSTFDNLLGQEHIVKTLVNQIKSDRLGHAYLFTGTRGTGKTSAAKIFAKAINCISPINGSPCGECEVCRALSDPSNIDVLEIDAASNNGVNEIRDLREKVQYPPVSCRYKVYIIDEVHMLTGAAFNALLKTLEEPPKHVVFILATTEVHKIPATILSRCMRFDFRLVSTETIAQLISRIYDEQGKKYEKEAVFAIAKAGEGSIRDALSVADIALSCNSGTLTYEDVLNVLGSSNEELVIQFISALIDGDSGAVLQITDNLSGLGKSMGLLIKDVSATVRDLLVVKTCSSANNILMLPEVRFNQMKTVAEKTNEERLLRILQIFAEAENSLKFTNNPRIVFETAAVKASRPDSDYSVDALLARIKALETQITNGSFAVLEPKETKKQEVKIEPKEEKRQENKKVFISELKVDELRGKLLAGLRNIGSEMLWNIVQNVSLDIKSNSLVITTETDGDCSILDKKESREKILLALGDVEKFELVVKLSEKERYLDQIDEATERAKKMFGSDIVIIK